MGEGSQGSHMRNRQERLPRARDEWGESPLQLAGHWERNERFRHEHSHTGEHVHGGARGTGLGEAVAGIKHHEKVQGWHQRAAEKEGRVVVDGALPPVPAGAGT